MPRGIPKPEGACERTGCYELAAAHIHIWNDAGYFGFRESDIEVCVKHAIEYEYDPRDFVIGNARIRWYSDAMRDERLKVRSDKMKRTSP